MDPISGFFKGIGKVAEGVMHGVEGVGKVLTGDVGGGIHDIAGGVQDAAEGAGDITE